MIGDQDANGDYWQPRLFGPPGAAGQAFPGIDALVRARRQNGVINPNSRNLFISSSYPVTNCPGAPGWPVTPGRHLPHPAQRRRRAISE